MRVTLIDFEVNTVLKSSVDLDFKSYFNQRLHYDQQLPDLVRKPMPTGLFYHFHGEYIQHKIFVHRCMHSLSD